jgi:hypothetical protein
MDNTLYNKICLNELQKALNNNDVIIEDFNGSFSRISISGITISKAYNDFIMNLSEDIDDSFFKEWKNTICKFFIKDMRKELYNLYKIVKYKNFYYLLRIIDDKKLADFTNITYVDNEYSLVTMSDDLSFSTTCLDYFKLSEYFNSRDREYECIIAFEEVEDSDELTSKTLFEEDDLTN